MEKNTTNKRGRTVGIVLIFTCLLLILVSKTIYMYRLPVATATIPFHGALSKTERATGLANWAQIVDVYAAVGGKVEAVFVAEGQVVAAGEALFRLSFAQSEVERSGREIEVARSQKQVEVSNCRQQLETSRREVLRAEKDVEDRLALYEAGALSRKEYEEAQSHLQSVRDQEIVLQGQLSQLELDLQAYDLQKEAQASRLSDFAANTVVYAPINGEIAELSVSVGQQLTDGFLAGRIGGGDSYEVTCTLSLDNNFVTLGDTCKLKNTNHSLSGTVTQITLTENGKRITVMVNAAIASGETFQVTFEKDSSETYTLVPNAALNMDGDGYFLYQVKQRTGALGEEFYVQKVRVYIGDSDDQNTVITKGLSFFEPIVLSSSKALNEGKTVRLSNVGDFFE